MSIVQNEEKVEMTSPEAILALYFGIVIGFIYFQSKRTLQLSPWLKQQIKRNYG